MKKQIAQKKKDKSRAYSPGWHMIIVATILSAARSSLEVLFINMGSHMIED